jgi:hypothetical protein
MNGMVLEEGTDKPISGAIIAVEWHGHVSSGAMFVEASKVCYHVGTATTDEQGRYRTKSWKQPQRKEYTVNFDRITMTVYKRGYGGPKALYREKNGVIYLAPFTGTREERLKFLKGIATGSGCGDAGESQRRLYPLYKELYYEAKAQGATEKDLQWFRQFAAANAVAQDSGVADSEGYERAQKFLQDNLK